MNILVIGNGFDLAHELPTRYTDFLEFIKLFTDCYEKVKNGTMDWVYYDTSIEVNSFLKKWFSAFYENENGQSKEEKEATVKIIDEFYVNIRDNFWIEYFGQCNMHGDENWIDFESEISKVIQSLDKDISTFDFEKNTQSISNKYLNEKYYDAEFQITYKQLRNKLLNDLNRLIRAFEIYLTEYVEKIDCKLISPDIQKILPKETMKINGVPVYDVCVLSFNYTNTYQRLYVDNVYKHIYVERNIDYIHGKADINNTLESNNMVLGIDEYLSNKRKNKNIEFIAFKKYYQRIYKGTGCKYKNWVDNIWEEKNEYELSGKKYPLQIPFNQFPKEHGHYVYFFGHSLDVTDKDILRDLILNDNVYTTIFYHDKDTMGKQIANLVKVIGQDELIRRTGGNTKTIEFKLQQKMKEINS